MMFCVYCCCVSISMISLMNNECNKNYDNKHFVAFYIIILEIMKVEDNDWINEIYLKVTIQDLEEENKKLNIKVASLEWEIKWLNSVIDKLKEENQTLELWLDRKEKLNEKYRKELKNYVYDAKQVRDIC